MPTAMLGWCMIPQNIFFIPQGLWTLLKGTISCGAPPHEVIITLCPGLARPGVEIRVNDRGLRDRNGVATAKTY